MADQVQLRGGTTAEHSTFTGAMRETTVDTSKKTLVVHDGVTPGGFPLLRQDMSNVSAASARTVLGVGSSGATAPAVTYAFMLWADTANDLLKQRNAADSGWISLLTISTGKSVSASSADVAVNGVKAGTIIDWCGSSAPSGYLACPVAPTNISRTTYADLFAAIGTTWGSGDGSTTFGMPYLPANQTTVQANANVGTTTVGEVISHGHSLSATLGSFSVQSGVGALGESNGASNTGSTGGTANLPAGVRVLKCVKY